MKENDRSSSEKRNAKLHASRRQVLGAATSVGVLGTTKSKLAEIIDGGSPSEIEIVISYKYKDPYNPERGINKEWKSVPKDWYEELKSVREVRNQNEFEKIPGIQSVDVLPGKYGGRSSKIRVGVSESSAERVNKSVDNILGSIPEFVNGIEIKKEKVGDHVLDNCYDDDYEDTIPGGAIVVNKDEGVYGTFSAAVYASGNGPFYATNRHIFNNYDYPNLHEAYHPDGNHDNAVADIFEDNCQKDYILASDFNGHSPSSEIAGTSLTTVEEYTKNGIDDLIAQDKSATKNGVRTCETSGKIYASDGYIGYIDDGCSNRYHQVKGEWNVRGGDSGSITYRDVGGGEAKVLSMNAGHDPTNDNAFGFGAWHLDKCCDIYWG